MLRDALTAVNVGKDRRGPGYDERASLEGLGPSEASPLVFSRDSFTFPTSRRGGRAAEGDGLLNRYTGSNSYPGFESRPLRYLAELRGLISQAVSSLNAWFH